MNPMNSVTGFVCRVNESSLDFSLVPFPSNGANQELQLLVLEAECDTAQNCTMDKKMFVYTYRPRAVGIMGLSPSVEFSPCWDKVYLCLWPCSNLTSEAKKRARKSLRTISQYHEFWWLCLDFMYSLTQPTKVEHCWLRTWPCHNKAGLLSSLEVLVG